MSMHMLANGLVILECYLIWGAALMCAGIVSVIALILTLTRRGPSAARGLSLIAVGIAFLPAVVPLHYRTELARFSNALYTENIRVFWFTAVFGVLTFVPLAIGLLAVVLRCRHVSARKTGQL